MAFVFSSATATALARSHQRKVVRFSNGRTWIFLRNGGWISGSTTADGGASWWEANALNNAVDNFDVFVDADDYVHLVYRDTTYGQLFYRRGTPNADRTTITWSTPIFQVSADTTDNYPSIVAHREGAGWMVHILAYNGTSGGGLNHFRISVSSSGAIAGAGNVSVVASGSAAATASLELRHTGDGKTTTTPDVWAVWSTGSSIRFRRAAYSAGTWTWGPERNPIAAGAGPQQNSGTWINMLCDGQGMMFVGFLESGTTRYLWIWERSLDDTSNVTWMNTTADPAYALLYGSATHDPATRDIHILGRNSDAADGANDLVRRVFSRGSGLGPEIVLDANITGNGWSTFKRGATDALIEWAFMNGSGIYYDKLLTNRAPTAPTWVTPQNTVIPVDADFDLDWDFADPDPGDTQSEYVLDRWTLDANGARVAGSNVRVTVTTPSSYRRITAGSLAVGAYEYKVATRDSQGAPSDPAQLVFSESLFVTAAESPDPPTFVAPGPIAGETISTSSREYVISAPDVDASEWTLYADNNGTIDTTTVLAGPVTKTTGDLRRHTFTGLANNTAVWAQVEIKDGGLWSQPTQQRNPVAYSPPPAPTYILLEDPDEGEIVVQINNPAPGAGQVATSYNDVFITDPGKPEQRRATEIPANGAWTYQLPPSGFDGITTGAVRVEAIADNGTRTSSA